MEENIKSYKDLQVWQEAMELQQVQNQLEQVSRLLSGLICSLKT